MKPTNERSAPASKLTTAITAARLFEVRRRAGKLHVHWEARRVQLHTLPDPFAATIATLGNGSAARPAAAGIK